MKRTFHKYKKEFGANQEDLVRLYLRLGKDLDEMCELMKPVPRSSIRGRISEIKNEKLREAQEVLRGIPNLE